MKTVHQWLEEYGESHQNQTNKRVHWICVPAIFFSITGLLFSVKISGDWNLAYIALLLVVIYYFRLSFSLGIGMLLYASLCLFFCWLIEQYAGVQLWIISLIIFVVAWFGQFYGHEVEGKKPSFFKDLQFLLIGPLWIMSFIFRQLGIRF